MVWKYLLAFFCLVYTWYFFIYSRVLICLLYISDIPDQELSLKSGAKLQIFMNQQSNEFDHTVFDK